MAKLPALQFYPGDWRKDVGVQSLSYHDRGVWFEMLMLMHESEQRGYLMLGGEAMPDEILASILHLPLETLRETITTLVARGVTHRCKRTNALVNRRMIRDDERLAENRSRMSKWRKVKKTKEVSNTPVTPPVTQDVTQMLRLSSSSYLGNKNITENDGPSGQSVTDPSVATMVVLERCGLSATRAFLEAVGDQAKLALQAGENLHDWAEQAIQAHLDYTEARPRLEYPVGPERFFATGLYRRRGEWKYSSGPTPGKRKYWTPEAIQ